MAADSTPTPNIPTATTTAPVDAAAATSPSPLHLLTTLRSLSSGLTRAWQSTAHRDPSTPLLATASADKSVSVWSLRDFRLVSTIAGGHKRSVRTVDWKDYGYGYAKRSGQGGRMKGVVGMNVPEQAGDEMMEEDEEEEGRKPVVLGTGSFDSNVGIWMWNDDKRRTLWKSRDNDVQGKDVVTVNGQKNDTEIDVMRDEAIEVDDEDDEEDEEWHFSTLLTGPDSEIKSIQFSPVHYGANLLATSSRDKSVWVWEEVEPEEWETIAVLTEHTGDVKCVSWCTGASRRRKESDGDVAVVEDEEDDVAILGRREILASGSYDDTIRLWRDVEEEGDWVCVGVIDGHTGTVWDVCWEGHVNYEAKPDAQNVQEFEREWEARIVSCSDDLTVRVWRRELSEQEREKKRSAARFSTGPRLPSIIRPTSVLERWVEDAQLPQVHVRSVYAVDWSKETGLVVSCGGDGTIAVYKEVVDEAVPDSAAPAAPSSSDGDGDVVMNGTAESEPQSPPAPDVGSRDGHQVPVQGKKMKWTVVALMGTAHDEYEINHVCWAARRDNDTRFEGEEVIVSTGDDGDVRIWTLPEGIL